MTAPRPSPIARPPAPPTVAAPLPVSPDWAGVLLIAGIQIALLAACGAAIAAWV